MTFEQFVDVFRLSAASYVPVSPNDPLNFHYDKVWYNNVGGSNKYPSMLFECAPDFQLVGQQSNNRTGQQVIKGKLFFYDKFFENEKGVSSPYNHIVHDQAKYKKQSDLNELALKIIGDINTRILAANSQQIQWGDGFFALDVHNPELVQVYISFQATLRSECTPLET